MFTAGMMAGGGLVLVAAALCWSGGCKPKKTTFRVAGPHLLITEVSDRDPEFIEIYNPTLTTVSLEGYRLSDQADYYYVTTGGNSGGVGLFNYAFPAGSSIGPLAYVVVASDGAEFSTAIGRPADFVLMTGTTGLLTNNGDSVFLFWWDGVQGSLVTDVDMVAYGDGNGAWPVDKTGVTGAVRTYRDDSAAGTMVPALNGKSMKRIDLSEGEEARDGGNGMAGHDETDEAIDETFTVSLPKTPWGP